MNDIISRYVADANQALEFKLVRQKEDLDDHQTSFRPEMSHQVFGENENIFGYIGLRIKLYYTAGSLQTYLGLKYKDKVDSKNVEGLEPDNIEKKIAEVIAPGYTTSIDVFTERIEKDNKFKPAGKLEHVFHVKSNDGSERKRTFEVYYSEVSTPGFLDYHQRLQTFLLWYVDAASFIDVDDDMWTFFTVFEKYETSDGEKRYATVGYSTIYRYYAYPKNIRPRISQVLILPPYRKIGVCSEMLQAIYNHFITLPEVVDMTVEDPSPEFQRIRDYVDAKNAQNLPAFAPNALKNGFTKEMATQAQKKLKMCTRQARRVYEILRLKNTNLNDSKTYTAYRLDIKNRLNAPYQKKKMDLKKLEKVLSREEYMTAISSLSTDETRNRLRSHYMTLEEEYLSVVKRLNKH